MLGKCAVLLGLVVVSQAEMESFIVGSEYASIRNYPYSAFMSTTCVKKDKTAHWNCGASVVNQWILLTAGHCVHSCKNGTHIMARFGSDSSEEGMMRSASRFLLHEKYDSSSSQYDIALIKLFYPLRFSAKVSRVALMRKPPYKEKANLAGWGLVNETTGERSMNLKYVVQNVWKRIDCEKKFNGVPIGTICASAPVTSDYASRGDSGSALVVQGYIQIGLVSYKVPDVASNVIVYTDTGYFYDWINYNAQRLHCSSD